MAKGNFKYVILSFLNWTLNILKFALQRGRYLLLAPACLSSQIVYDRQANTFMNIRTRDQVEFETFSQVYLKEDYSLNKLRRCAEIFDYYKAIISARKIPLIIDCGGNIGFAARYFSENYDKAKILCVEPDGDNVLQAKKNNTSKGIVFIESAIGSEAGYGSIIDPGRGNNSYRMSSNSEGSIKIISMNDLLAEYSEATYAPFIVKIDIEGFEEDLFSKNTEWIDKFPLLIIELHDWMLPKRMTANNFIKAIAPLNRDFVYNGENVFSISNSLL